LPDAHDGFLLYTRLVERGSLCLGDTAHITEMQSKILLLVARARGSLNRLPLALFMALVLKAKQKIGRPYNTKILQLPDAPKEELRYD
jgi:hypothetical protein